MLVCILVNTKMFTKFCLGGYNSEVVLQRPYHRVMLQKWEHMEGNARKEDAVGQAVSQPWILPCPVGKADS